MKKRVKNEIEAEVDEVKPTVTIKYEEPEKVVPPTPQEEFVCQRCRNCCVSFDLRVDKSEVDDLARNEFYKVRGIYFYEGDNGFWYAHLHQDCQHLKVVGHGGEGHWACDIYMLRPRICQTYSCRGERYIP